MQIKIFGIIQVLCVTIFLACQPPPSSSQISGDSVSSGMQPMPNSAAEWTELDSGLSVRIYEPYEQTLAQFTAVRIDPAHYNFRVHYRPGEALTLDEWRQVLPDADIIINANFFDHNLRTLGLLVTDGASHGQSYWDRGGTFAIENGLPRIWSNIHAPYQGQPLDQAVQAFPMLVRDGVQAFTNSSQNRRSRRTVIAMDTSGHIILMVSPGLGLGLYDLSAYLATIDAELVQAFNLDGGGSSMLYVAPSRYRIPSFDGVPAVLAAYARQNSDFP